MESRRQEIVTFAKKRSPIIPEGKSATQRVPDFEVFHRRGNGPANRMGYVDYPFATGRVAAMRISSRTPEGSPNHCPVCGKAVRMEPSTNSANTADAPCPHCGCLMWFDARQLKLDESLEKVKMQIQDWRNDFKALSKSATDPVEYYRKMLNGLVSMLAAHGGAVWMRDSGDPLIQCRAWIGSREIAERALTQVSHSRLVKHAFDASASTAIQPNGHPQSTENNDNPTDSLLLFGPVKRKSETVAMVEIFQRTGSRPSVQRGYLRFLQQICDVAGRSKVVGGGNVEG